MESDRILGRAENVQTGGVESPVALIIGLAARGRQTATRPELGAARSKGECGGPAIVDQRGRTLRAGRLDITAVRFRRPGTSGGGASRAVAAGLGSPPGGAAPRRWGCGRSSRAGPAACPRSSCR